MVIVLALANPDLAREVLECMESVERSKRRLGRVDWNLAWALVGDDQFPELARQCLAEAKDVKARDLALLHIVKMVEVLTMAPANRPEHVMKYRGGL